MNDQYEALYQSFTWLVPTQFNIAQVCCHRWGESTADARRLAIYFEDEAGQREVWTYARLAETTNQFANGLLRMGVNPGDRVAVALGQRPETVVAYMAILSVGGVAVPLSASLDADAMAMRLSDAEAHVAVTDMSACTPLLEAAQNCRGLRQIVGIGFTDDRAMSWRTLLARQPIVFRPIPTRATDPALLLYTSGTTGEARGAVLSHGALIGALPGFVASHNWFPKIGDVFWSPADWAGTSGLMDALLPTLYFGHPIVGTAGRFSPERAYELMERYQVTHAFFHPAALKMMMKTVPKPREFYKLSLRAVVSAGEALAEPLFDWCRDALGVVPNEMFGQTEMNYLIGNSDEKWPAKPGSMGRPYPGHRVALLDEQGVPCQAGEMGEIAVHREDTHGHPDPVLFTGYWHDELGTQARYLGDWCRSGDLARQDSEGYFWYVGRADDVFKSSGHRIGPGEIESCLTSHPSVASAAVVPKPDVQHGALIKAYVVLTVETAHQDRDALTQALQDHVASRLSPYQYPREIEFVDELPTTASGKIQRSVLRERESARTPGTANQ